MTKATKVIIGLVIVLFFLGSSLIGSYNTLITLREGVNTSWSKVQADYQRRSDLIPNLVQTVQGAANFERGTLEDVINARARATQITVNANDAASLAKFQQAQGEISSALSRLMVVSEQYPTLQGVQAFRDLQTQLEGTENRIGVSRKDYSETVQAYNRTRSSFPTVILASIFNFQEKPYFEATSNAQTAPSVNFAPNTSTGSTIR